ncbi:T9SS type B sorting domain-containing protein [Changchengzhania lutea]|uniref:T9SS type B sorting domain-containing protein n=1 Tax=Changchengzhania lutea TaxID=2049305 RepID=UPI00115DD12E|nr:T9SS type B sorting domain-containing protein [Changchengzhania lutea]
MWATRTLYWFTFFVLIGFIGSSQNTYVPDDNFEQALIEFGFDTPPLDDFVPTINISSIKNLDVAERDISDLTGIEDFTSLLILDCSVNTLTSLNISGNKNLTELYVYNNQITAIDVTPHPNLKILWCFSNSLSSLNVTKNTNLISLVCWDNNLTRLDVSNNTGLNVLVCEQNQLTMLDVSKNTTLNRFQCGNNLLSNLDISNNSNLTVLGAGMNNLSVIDVSQNKNLDNLNVSFNLLNSLDISQNKGLTVLDCSNNLLCNLNVKNGNNTNITSLDFTGNSDLNCVVVDNSSDSKSNWQPAAFSNYVTSASDCNALVEVDFLENVVTKTTYTLPNLTNGNYFTQSGGGGSPLNAGDIISTSQTIYIYNETTCNSNESNFNVIITDEDYIIPKYFTPNNDGSNDTWFVQDLANAVKSVSIFNSYGKLLKYLPAHALGWNGTVNGQPMPTNDYWYMITLNSGETLKGHFTLKR